MTKITTEFLLTNNMNFFGAYNFNPNFSIVYFVMLQPIRILTITVKFQIRELVYIECVRSVISFTR